MQTSIQTAPMPSGEAVLLGFLVVTLSNKSLKQLRSHVATQLQILTEVVLQLNLQLPVG